MGISKSYNINSSLGVQSKFRPSKKNLVDDNILTYAEPEKVFLCTSQKPVETSTTFPETLIGSDNRYELFLNKDF